LTEKELNKFLNASSEIGKNFNLIQGAGGNTSYKMNDSLFIKASGFKLKNSLKENMFVEVNYKKLNKAIINNKLDPLKYAWNSSQKIKPSIETSMHSILPFKYVFHVHCLNTISWVVRRNFESEFKNIFSNQNYEIIKYTKPGLALTREIKKTISNHYPDILFLKNHGLVVGSENIDHALELILLVMNKLNKDQNDECIILNDKKLNNFTFDTPYRPISYKNAHKIAFKKEYIDIALNGTLFPDQVVFLGNSICSINTKQELKLLINSLKNSKYLPIIIVPNLGILVPKSISEEAEEIILALQIILSKIPKNEKINFLNQAEENELLNWEAEQYRLNLNNIKN
tara:strand:- start:841 stop:1869 length:1029 start_codon:yes stop_codon:yes gene_type:complete